MAHTQCQLNHLPLFSQGINNLKPNTSSLLLIPNTHKKDPKFTTIVKAQSGNEDHLQKTSIKTPQQKQPIKRRPAQSPPIGLWDRFPAARTVQQMMDTMERLIEEPQSYNGISGGAWGPPEDITSRGRVRTPWEIKEGEEDYNLRFDMPGMTKEDVKVWVEEKMLVLKAEKLQKDNKNGGSDSEGVEEDVWSAKSYGKYSYRIALPENIQFEKIKAEVRDGVLYVVIPKAPVSSKILDINVG